MNSLFREQNRKYEKASQPICWKGSICGYLTRLRKSKLNQPINELRPVKRGIVPTKTKSLKV